MHTPSEHTVNGKAHDGEAHFVHKNADGGALLTVGLFFDASKDVETDAFFTKLVGGMNKVTESHPVNLKLQVVSDDHEKSLANYTDALGLAR